MRADNQAKNKIKNKNLILKKIITSGGISRVGLSKFAGLTKMTVTNLVNELTEEKLICEKGGQKNRSVGRNPIMLTGAEDNYIIGIYLCRDYVEVFAGNICGKIYECIRTVLEDETEESINKKISESLDIIIKKYKHVHGIGISAIGPVDSKKGIILNPPNFFDIKNYKIVEYLHEKYSLPVYMDNDMNTSAVAEKYWGYAVGISDFIYLGASNGIGAGIVMDGKLCIRAAGEIGHVSVDINGKKCRCGNRGCLELYASIDKNFSGENSEKICEYIAAGTVTLMNLFNPKAIFFGHRIPLLGSNAPEIIGKYMLNSYITRDENKVDLRFSKFGQNSPVYGAIAVFIERHIF